jgi:chromate transporter
MEIKMAAVPLPSRKPRSLFDIFFSFTLLALQGFGGVLAVVQRGIVEKKRWLTKEEFIEEMAVAQVMPGPNVVNLALMIGARYFGLPGALAALAGMIVVPMVLVVLLAAAYGHFAENPALVGALRGMGAVTAGLIGATAMKLTSTLWTHPLGRSLAFVFCGLGFIAVALLRFPLLYVLPVLGGVACALTYKKLKQ